MLKATISQQGRSGSAPASAPAPAPVADSAPASVMTPPAESMDQIQAALQVVAGSMTLVRVHEQILRTAGVRLDRAGAALLYKLHVHGDSLRVTELADLLGVDAPTVTRKIQQLERAHLVSRLADPDDRRACRISLTREGKRSLERVLRARRGWLEHMVDGWDEADLATFASLLGRFSASLSRDLEDLRDI